MALIIIIFLFFRKTFTQSKCFFSALFFNARVTLIQLNHRCRRNPFTDCCQHSSCSKKIKLKNVMKWDWRHVADLIFFVHLDAAHWMNANRWDGWLFSGRSLRNQRVTLSPSSATTGTKRPTVDPTARLSAVGSSDSFASFTDTTKESIIWLNPRPWGPWSFFFSHSSAITISVFRLQLWPSRLKFTQSSLCGSWPGNRFSHTH